MLIFFIRIWIDGRIFADNKALFVGQNITANERTLLEIIVETTAEIDHINDATNAYDIATVTSADKANSDIDNCLHFIARQDYGNEIFGDFQRHILKFIHAQLAVCGFLCKPSSLGEGAVKRGGCGGFLSFKTFIIIKKLTLINPEWFATIIRQTQIEFEGV